MFNTEMTQLLSLEMMLCVVVVLLLVCVAGWQLYIKMTGFYDSNLFIIIGNEEGEVHIPIIKLRYPLTFYQFHVSGDQWDIILVNSFSSVDCFGVGNFCIYRLIMICCRLYFRNRFFSDFGL